MGAHVFLLSCFRPRLCFACQAGYVCLTARGPDDYAAVLQVHSSAAPASPLRSAAAFGLSSARTPSLCSTSLAALTGDEHGPALQTMLALSSPCRATAWGDLLAWAAHRWQAEGCRCDPPKVHGGLFDLILLVFLLILLSIADPHPQCN